MNKILEIIKNNSLVLAFFFYEFIITLRIIIEMEDLTFYIFVHQLFWFNCVLACFFFCFKRLLGIKPDRLWCLAGGSILTFIPLIFSKIIGIPWQLNYIEPVSLSQVVKDVATLLYKHPYNWPMFPELMALLICSTIAGYVLSKKLLRSFFVSLLALYSSFLILGFSWIAVNPEHPALFHFTTPLPEQQFYALQMIITFSVIAFAASVKKIG